MNPVVHFEMPYDNRERVAKFYEAVFGWQMEKMPEEMGSYILATTAVSDAKPGSPAGAINGGFFPRRAGSAQHPSIVIGVEDIVASMNSVTKAGGKVLGDPLMIPGVGRYVQFLDTEGNQASLLQPLPGMDQR